MEGLVWWLLIGGVAGFLAGMIMKGKGFGVVGNIVVGILGAFLGGWLLGVLGVTTYGLLGTLISATLGAVVLLWIVNKVAAKGA